jgi:hypothetical protein
LTGNLFADALVRSRNEHFFCHAAYVFCIPYHIPEIFIVTKIAFFWRIRIVRERRPVIESENPGTRAKCYRAEKNVRICSIYIEINRTFAVQRISYNGQSERIQRIYFPFHATLSAFRADATARRADTTARHADSTARHADATARRADSTARRADTTACRADATARHADATARHADATARRADATARRADATARRADATAHRADATARHADATAEKEHSIFTFKKQSTCIIMIISRRLRPFSANG